jgi:hypothetical protein
MVGTQISPDLEASSDIDTWHSSCYRGFHGDEKQLRQEDRSEDYEFSPGHRAVRMKLGVRDEGIVDEIVILIIS